jgi:hypothetical protein
MRHQEVGHSKRCQAMAFSTPNEQLTGLPEARPVQRRVGGGES